MTLLSTDVQLLLTETSWYRGELKVHFIVSIDAIVETCRNKQRSVGQICTEVSSSSSPRSRLHSRPGKTKNPKNECCDGSAHQLETSAPSWLWTLKLAALGSARTTVNKIVAAPTIASLWEPVYRCTVHVLRAPLIELQSALFTRIPKKLRSSRPIGLAKSQHGFQL